MTKDKKWGWFLCGAQDHIITSGEVYATTARKAMRCVRSMNWGGPGAGSVSKDHFEAKRHSEILRLVDPENTGSRSRCNAGPVGGPGVGRGR